MTYGVNTYETANATGTTVTAGNSTDGGAGFTPTVANSGTVKFDSTHVHRGSMAVAFDATAGITAVARKDISSISGATDLTYGAYCWIDSAPGTSDARICEFVTSGSNVRVVLLANRTLRVLNAAGTSLFTTTGAMSTGVWWRWYMRVVPVSGSLGTIEFRVYTGTDLETTTATESYLPTPATMNTGTTSSVSAIRTGKLDSACTLKIWVDDDQFDTTGAAILPLTPSTAYALVPAGSATSTGTISALGLSAPLTPAGTGAGTGAVSTLKLTAPLTVTGSGASTGAATFALTAPLTVTGTAVSAGTVAASAVAIPLVVTGSATSTASAEVQQRYALTIAASASSLGQVGALAGPVRDVTVTAITEPSRYTAATATTRYAATVEETP